MDRSDCLPAAIRLLRSEPVVRSQKCSSCRLAIYVIFNEMYLQSLHAEYSNSVSLESQPELLLCPREDVEIKVARTTRTVDACKANSGWFSHVKLMLKL
jgi:hypothetical protein